MHPVPAALRAHLRPPLAPNPRVPPGPLPKSREARGMRDALLPPSREATSPPLQRAPLRASRCRPSALGAEPPRLPNPDPGHLGSAGSTFRGGAGRAAAPSAPSAKYSRLACPDPCAARARSSDHGRIRAAGRQVCSPGRGPQAKLVARGRTSVQVAIQAKGCLQETEVSDRGLIRLVKPHLDCIIE
ncbi:hypothetical protein B0H15DRAFT_834604 [Mycena belliarum]|uniref:Uncharacterized protein n=1 Tax=Mycena belliarum TaxID=1033014 RepID=A0AAD6U8E6_9AGAR|nr:hypothetical protein B0H15DRAFT_834604 [Mycena belliae]